MSELSELSEVVCVVGRGRPRKMNKKVSLSSSSSKDLFEELVRERDIDGESVCVGVCSEEVIKVSVSEVRVGGSDKKEAKLSSKKAEKEAKKEAEKEAKKAEKEAKQAAKKAEKEAKRAAKKAEKEAKQAAKKAEKEAKLAANKAEKEAKLAANKAEKEAKLAAKKAAKKAEKEAEKEAKKEKKPKKSSPEPEPEPELVSESEPEEVEEEPDRVAYFEYEGVKYLKSKNTGVIYNLEQELIGKWNEEKKAIDFYAADESECEEDEECKDEEYDE